ncbi:MAG: PilZ domain-containing protein [Acidobacteria bacterium]|nr:PilZ domain-containing protein [Acidobacteriota bacterium]
MNFPASNGDEVKQQSGRRRHIRYKVEGSLVLQTEQRKYTGVPANLGLGGIMFTADPVPAEGTEGKLELNVVGFKEPISAEVRVIRTYETAAAAVILSGSHSLVRCIGWLAREGTKT